jgi:hypothetical protein
MATATTHTTIADLLEGLGGIPARRVLLKPTPGTATERDLIELHGRTNRLYELVDGTLVEKAVGFDESRFAVLLTGYLLRFLERHDLGAIVGADAFMRIFPGLVRAPDTAFISWGRYPRKKRRRGEIPAVAPDLVVEVLSKGDTHREMKRKLEEYFRAGVRLVWHSTRASGPCGSTRRWIARPCSARTRPSTAATSCRDSRCRSATGSPRPGAPGRASRRDQVVADPVRPVYSQGCRLRR